MTVFGTGVVRALYVLLLLLAYGTTLGLWLRGGGTAWLLLPWLTLPLAALNMRRLADPADRETMHKALKGTSALHLLFGLLLTAALLAGGLPHSSAP